MLAVALFNPQILIEEIDLDIKCSVKAYQEEKCKLLLKRAVRRRYKHPCVNPTKCRVSDVEHYVFLPFHRALLLAKCLRGDKPDMRELVHIIFGRGKSLYLSYNAISLA